MQMLNPRMIGQSFALTSLSVLAGCGFFKKSAPASVMKQADRPDSAATTSNSGESSKSPLDQLSLAWINDDLKLQGKENENHAKECVKLCQPSDWLRLEFSFKQPETMVIPSRIPGDIGLRNVLKVNVNFAGVPGVKSTFSCSFTRLTPEKGKEAKDYKLNSCSDGRKAFSIFKAQKVVAALEQSGLPETVKSYTIGKSGSLQIACLNLPKDPGKAGLATVLGIDSDKDGVRDDVQRWIDLSFPASKPARNALRQYAADIQNELTAIGNDAKVLGLVQANAYSMMCADYVLDKVEKRTDDMEIIRQFHALNYNSYLRMKAVSRIGKAISGKVIDGGPVGKEAQYCKFNLDER